jgi:hypothetical protein
LVYSFLFPDKEKDCGGYLYTYLAWNDYLNADPSPRIIWELKHYFYEQVVKVFDLEEFVLKDKFPILEFGTCARALQHNTWFTTLRSSGITLGNDSVGLLVDIFKRNKTIHTLILEDGGVTRGQLLQAVYENPNLHMERLSFTGNSFDN